MKVSELFGRCVELSTVEPSAAALRYMHQTLVLACGEALRDTPHAFGNVFAQVDYLCRERAIALADRIAIQTMRRHSNGGDTLTTADWLYDVRALTQFVAAVFHAAIPHELLTRIPQRPKPYDAQHADRLPYVRCVVTDWEDTTLTAATDQGPVMVSMTDDTLPQLLRQGMQLNLLDGHREGDTIVPGLVVVEPDFLVDISSVAACFQDYGHHPLAYLLARLKPRANTQPILLGNFAGAALDEQIHHAPAMPDFGSTMQRSFREQAVQFCTCPSFNAAQFKADAWQQVQHIREAVGVLAEAGYDLAKALLEPSFVCEQLGLQGRVDLMTSDMRLLVEQKSGKRWGNYSEAHYVQLLLYYGVLRYNFHLSADRLDIRLLYSRYPAREGLVAVNYYQQLFREAIRLRNRIVAQEVACARDGFRTVAHQLRADQLLEDPKRSAFFYRYVYPEADRVLRAFGQLTEGERDYVERLLTFVFREQLAQKVGVQEGQGGAVADLWNMPLAEKQDAGTILVVDDGRLVSDGGVPNFRQGDMVYIYPCDGQPDVRRHILYKGVIDQLTDTTVRLRLLNSQQDERLLDTGRYVVEHASSDIGTTSALRSVYSFCSARQERRDLLLGIRQPRRDATLQLTRSYHPHYDDIVLRALQARDYFLLQGPPGTGKTSMALRFLVEESLAHADGDRPASVLLTAYTNRAVDEICGMLTAAGIDYLRLGSGASCDERYHGRLLDHALGDRPRLETIRQLLADMRVVVATTSMLLSQPYVLQLKRFAVCMVDEASQIIAPNLVGLLVNDHIGRFILIGDHKQLPAVVQQPDSEPRLHDCRQSLFEQLLRREQQLGRTDFTGILRRQGRMHPDIAAFPNEHFYRREQLMPVPCEHQLDTSLHYDQPAEDALDVLLQRRRVLFLPSEPCRNLTTSDKVNTAEARIVADLLRRIYRQYGADRFDAATTVGVIVPYRNQIAMIRRETERLAIPALMDVSIDTVERYQGSQRDVIIYSFTVQQAYQLDFLTANCFEEDGCVIDRKLNVAMTRARKQLLMTGNKAVLQQNALFADLIRRYSV